MLLASCALTPGLDTGSERMVEAVLPMADAALESGQNETARRLYSRLLAAMPDSMDARMGLGRVSMADRDPAQAATWYLSAVANASSASQRHDALLAHARAALAAGQHGEALRSFSTLAASREGAPGWQAAWGFNGVGVVRWLEGDPHGAVAAIEQAVARHPQEPAFRSNLDAATKMLGTMDLGSLPAVAATGPALPDILATSSDAQAAVASVENPQAREQDASVADVGDAAPDAPRELCRWWLLSWPCEELAPAELPDDAAATAAGEEERRGSVSMHESPFAVADGTDDVAPASHPDDTPGTAGDDPAPSASLTAVAAEADGSVEESRVPGAGELEALAASVPSDGEAGNEATPGHPDELPAPAWEDPERPVSLPAVADAANESGEETRAASAAGPGADDLDAPTAVAPAGGGAGEEAAPSHPDDAPTVASAAPGEAASVTGAVTASAPSGDKSGPRQAADAFGDALEDLAAGREAPGYPDDIPATAREYAGRPASSMAVAVPADESGEELRAPGPGDLDALAVAVPSDGEAGNEAAPGHPDELPAPAWEDPEHPVSLTTVADAANESGDETPAASAAGPGAADDLDAPAADAPAGAGAGEDAAPSQPDDAHAVAPVAPAEAASVTGAVAASAPFGGESGPRPAADAFGDALEDPAAGREVSTAVPGAYVQVGAWSDAWRADAAADVVRVLTDDDVTVDVVDGSGRAMRRVRVGPVDPERVEDLVERLAREGYDAVVVPLPGSVRVDGGERAFNGAARETLVVVNGADTYLQVGAYADPGAADAVAVRLEAFTPDAVGVFAAVAGSGESVYRVRIGPVTRDRAEQLAELIDGAGIRF